MRKEKLWTHPVHGRGYKSPDYGRGCVGDVLTDAQIHAYALRGFYGTEVQRAAQAADKAKKSRKSTKPKRKPLTLALALEALGL